MIAWSEGWQMFISGQVVRVSVHGCGVGVGLVLGFPASALHFALPF